MDQDIRQMLRERAEDVAPHPLLPASTLRRAKHRRATNMLAAFVTSVAVMAGTVFGVQALRRQTPIPFENTIHPVLRKTIDLGDSADQVQVGFGSAWVLLRSSGGKVVRIEPQSGRVLAEISPGLLPPAGQDRYSRLDLRIGNLSAMTVGEGAVWATALPVESGPRLVTRGSYAAPQGGTGVQTFTATAQAVTPRSSPDASGLLIPGPSPTTVPPGPRANYTWRLLRIDPNSDSWKLGPAVTKAWQPLDSAAGAGSVWVAGGFDTAGVLYRFDPKTLALAGTTRIAGEAYSVEVGDGFVWVGVGGRGSDGGKILRIDPRNGKIVGRIAMPGVEPMRLLFGEGALWASTMVSARGPEARLYRIEPATATLSSKATIVNPGFLVAGDGYVWATEDSPPNDVVWVNPVEGTTAGSAELNARPLYVAILDGYLLSVDVPDATRLSIYALHR